MLLGPGCLPWVVRLYRTKKKTYTVITHNAIISITTLLVINSYYELHPPKERYVPLWILRHSQHPTQSLCVGTIKAPGRRRATIKLNVVTRIGLRLDRPLTRRSRRKLEYPLSL